MKHLACIAFAAVVPLLSPVRADEASEAKLKEQLKSALRENQNLKTQMGGLQRTQAELTEKNTVLEKSVADQGRQLEARAKEMTAYKESAEAKQMEQQARIAGLEAEVKRFQAALDKWQAANIQLTDIAKKKESERARLSAKSADLERAVTDLRARNSELFRLANEILTRYEQYSTGKALAAREPFTGNARVKLQNIVQDYQDKILDQTPPAQKAAAKP